MKNLSEIKKECESCKACILCENKTNTVFSDGNENSKIMLIGEAPGENEDLQGKPFVGMAGKILDRYLEKAGISRNKDLYITNIVKCRPPKNRKPKTSEKKSCFKYLTEQILNINPEVIILCGGTSLESFFKGEKISDVHGKILELNIEDKVFKCVPIYHPSPLCRVQNKEEITVTDLKTVYNLAK